MLKPIVSQIRKGMRIRNSTENVTGVGPAKVKAFESQGVAVAPGVGLSTAADG